MIEPEKTKKAPPRYLREEHSVWKRTDTFLIFYAVR